ncbi:hypothetical protein DITRI_Ditri19aG0115900 [Diplodiscus trichospermus]
MASAIGMMAGNGSSSWMQVKEKKKKKNVNRVRVCCSASCVMDPYKTLRIQPGASESEVKKAFRQLALQYHPDVCRGSNCGVEFQTINEAYDVCLSFSYHQTYFINNFFLAIVGIWFHFLSLFRN